MMFNRKKSKRGKQSPKSEIEKKPAKKAKEPTSFERTVQAKIGEKIWVSIKNEEDYSKLWQLFEVASLSSDKKSVYVSDKFTGNITEVKALETLSYDKCHEESAEEDLTRLNYLHEASLLFFLKERYFNDEIYSWFGDTLISINPYYNIPNLYSKEIKDISPHVNSVALRSYELLKQKRKSQSIVINGDSGAGKTEAAKQIMRHLVSLASKNSKTPEIEELVLASTPVLEAFGNSITLRNDNSSRFGRFIQILYSDDGSCITGMNTKHFLLEKSRLIERSPGERNYHIFYQLCANDPLNLGFESKEDYHYLQPLLSQDNYTGVIPNDKDNFIKTIEALDKIGINDKIREEIFKILLAILSLGNIDFIPDEENDKNNIGKCKISSDSKEYLMKVSDILDIDVKILEMNLISRTIETKNEITTIELTIEQANDSKNALSKYLYSTLFNWLISKLNNKSYTKQNKSKKKDKFIGILDIFGFEDLENNSFEQILVNYSNELLQNQFDLHIIQTERKLFLEEGVQFPNIILPSIISAEKVLNNLNNIVFSKLEEQCLLKSGTDKAFLTNMKVTDKLKLDWKNSTNFIITHFAGEVSYNSIGFIHKNRDSLVEDLKQTLYQSHNIILTESITQPKNKNKKMSNKETVLKAFQNDMNNLVSTLIATDTTFVRCIKPNHSQNSKEWDVKLILSQLEYLGINQAIRVHDETYPVRRPFSFIPERYFKLFNDLGVEYSPGINDKLVMKLILNKALGEESEFKLWQCGHTKVFLGNQVLFQLDSLVNEKRKAELAAMSEKQRQVELEKERERQRKELILAKAKLEEDNEALLEQHRKQFEEKEQMFQIKLRQKEKEMESALERMRLKYEAEVQTAKQDNEIVAAQKVTIAQLEKREKKSKQKEEELEEAIESMRIKHEAEVLSAKQDNETVAAQKERIAHLEKRVVELEEEDEVRQKALEKREKAVDDKYRQAEELIHKQQLALEHAKQSSALTKEEELKMKQLAAEQLLKLKEKEQEIELQHEQLKQDQHEREMDHQRKAYELQLAEEKMKRLLETQELERKMFEKDKKRVKLQAKRLKEEEDYRMSEAANKRLRKAAKQREKDEKKFAKQREYGAILMQKLVRGHLIKRNYQDMIGRSEHYRQMLRENEKVVFSSIIINEKPTSKGSKTKRRAMVLTSRRRLLICDPLTLKIEQKAKYDPKLCKTSATGVHGRLNIYIKSDWLATDSAEWGVRDLINDATTWVAVLSTLTDYSDYIKKGFYKCLKKRANKKHIIIPLKFGLLKMMDDSGKYSAGERLKQKKGKVTGGAQFLLCRRTYKHSMIWFENEKSEMPAGGAISIDRNGKLLIPNEGSVNGKLNIFMFCLLIKKRKSENMISFETRGRKDRDSWSKVLKKIIRRDKFRIHDIEKIKKQMKKQRSTRNVQSNNFRDSNRPTSTRGISNRPTSTRAISTRPKSSVRASNTLREDMSSLLITDERTSRNSKSKARATLELNNSSAPKSGSKKFKRGTSIRTLRRGKSKNKRGKKSKFNAETFLTAFEEADITSTANISGMKKS